MVKVRFDVEKKDFVVLENGSKEEGSFYLDGYLKTNLEYIKKDVRDDNDAVVVVTGKEGSGKSVFAMTVGYYLDPTLIMERVVFTPLEFKKRVLAAKKYQVVIYDEAITGLRAVRWSHEVNQALTELLAQIRQKNLIIIIVIPSFFELGKYVALHRSTALLHVYRHDGARGHFKAYADEKKTKLYLLGKKTYDYSLVTPDFFGSFTNFYPVDEAEYRRKKLEALSETQSGIGQKALRFKAQRDVLIAVMNKHFELPAGEIAALIAKGSQYALSQSQISHIIEAQTGVYDSSI